MQVQCIWNLFRPLDFSHILICYSLVPKLIKLFFPLITLHTMPHNDKAKTVYCWSTFGSDYSLKSSWVWRYKLGTPVFGEFCPFCSAGPLKLCQVGWGAWLHSYFQVSSEMFDQVQVWALAGPLKYIQRFVPKSLLRCLDCVLRVVVLLEGEPSP